MEGGTTSGVKTPTFVTGTYDAINIPVGEVEVSESPEVIREGEAPFLSVSPFSNQIYGQVYHGDSPQTRPQRGSLSAPAEHSAHTAERRSRSVWEKRPQRLHKRSSE